MNKEIKITTKFVGDEETTEEERIQIMNRGEFNEFVKQELSLTEDSSSVIHCWEGGYIVRIVEIFDEGKVL